MTKEEAIIKCYSELLKSASSLEKASDYLEEVKTDDFNDLWRQINDLYSNLVDDINQSIQLPSYYYDGNNNK